MIKEISLVFIMNFLIVADIQDFGSLDKMSDNEIFVVSHGWHTGLVVQRADIPDSFICRYSRFTASKYIEFGWGDHAFYLQPDFNFWITLKAVFWPTPSVLHLAGFQSPLNEYFPFSDVVSLSVSKSGFIKMLLFIDSYFTVDTTGNSIPIAKGLYGDSQFYLSSSSYYFPKTCNVWTAQAIEQAGLPITPYLYQTAGKLMEYLRQVEKMEQDKKQEK